MPGTAGQTSAGDKMSLPGGGEAVWYKLEGSRAKHTDGMRRYMERKPPFAGTPRLQAAAAKTADHTVLVHFGSVTGCGRGGS